MKILKDRKFNEDLTKNFHLEYTVDGVKSSQNISAMTADEAKQLVRKQYSGRGVTFTKTEEIAKNATTATPAKTETTNEALDDDISDLVEDMGIAYEDFEYDDDFGDTQEYDLDFEEEDTNFVAPKPSAPTNDLDSGVAGLLNHLIQDEWQTVDAYNSAITSIRSTMGESGAGIIRVMEDIVNEENKHIGQLQEAMKTVSTNANLIVSGEVEGLGQLEGEKEEKGVAPTATAVTLPANDQISLDDEITIVDVDDTF